MTAHLTAFQRDYPDLCGFSATTRQGRRFMCTCSGGCAACQELRHNKAQGQGGGAKSTTAGAGFPAGTHLYFSHVNGGYLGYTDIAVKDGYMEVRQSSGSRSVGRLSPSGRTSVNVSLRWLRKLLAHPSDELTPSDGATVSFNGCGRSGGGAEGRP